MKKLKLEIGLFIGAVGLRIAGIGCPHCGRKLRMKVWCDEHGDVWPVSRGK